MKDAILAKVPVTATSTAISADVPMASPATGTGAATAAVKPRPKSLGYAWRALQALASLRLTVVLFALSLVLVFYGTWAQVDAGIWTVVSNYFRSALVWIPLRVILLRTVDIPGAIPFPG